MWDKKVMIVDKSGMMFTEPKYGLLSAQAREQLNLYVKAAEQVQNVYETYLGTHERGTSWLVTDFSTRDGPSPPASVTLANSSSITNLLLHLFSLTILTFVNISAKLWKKLASPLLIALLFTFQTYRQIKVVFFEMVYLFYLGFGYLNIWITVDPLFSISFIFNLSCFPVSDTWIPTSNYLQIILVKQSIHNFV